MKRQNEYNLQKQICEYIRLQYPNVLFLTDTVAAIQLTPMQGKRNKDVQKEGFKTPDLLILEPKGKYAGLMIELKIESPFYKGQFIELKSNEHIKEQANSLFELNLKGYCACFAWSFDMAKAIIDDYMRGIMPRAVHTHLFYEHYCNIKN
jgi:hypothetical protein